MGKRYVSERQLSEYSGIGVRTLQGWRMRNQGPPWRKLCGAVRYDLVAFESWVWVAGQPGGGGKSGSGKAA
jgi:hypothetical protein